MVGRGLRVLAALAPAVVLGGCDMVLLNPAGDVALRERDTMLASTALMLLIIVPVLAFTLIFAWRYRASNTTAVYDPDWHHSTQLEVLIWTAPLLIIIALGALTWMGTHILDPFRPLSRLDSNRTIAAGVKPITIEAVALDWKWLFFYPDQGVAAVNELVIPVDVPVNFKITSATVMNAFFVPALAGQIYAMGGMETKLSVVANRTGEFSGQSSHYSGAGFSHMNFGVQSLTQQGFDQWVMKAKASASKLDQATYMQLEKPSEEVPATLYAGYKPGLYDAILNMCTTPGKMCQSDMMHIDSMGGGGKDSEANRARLLDDSSGSKEGSEAPGATFPASGRPPNSAVQPEGMKHRDAAPIVNKQTSTPDAGQGHNMPGAPNQSPAPAQLNTH